MSISWGKRQRFKFDANGSLNVWTPPALAGIFAITYKQDPKNRPKFHTVLYFGEGENLSANAQAISNYLLDYWDGTPDDLHVFIHPMLGSSNFERSRVLRQLVSEYQPKAND